MRDERVWELVGRQHGVVTRAQLLNLGLSRKQVAVRVASRRLHVVRRGVYAVGRPHLTVHGHWMAAVLSCGPWAALSHRSAAGLLGLLPTQRDPVEVSIPAHLDRRPAGVTVHRRTEHRREELLERNGIRATGPLYTLVDIAGDVSAGTLERAVREADRLDLIDPEALRERLDIVQFRPGVRALRRLLDGEAITLTDTELERRFLPIAERAGLPRPLTQQWVNGFRVDFHWPWLGLVVETDGLRYHRTPGQQAIDRERDQAHTAAGMTCLRFTHAQVQRRPGYVAETLAATAMHLPRPLHAA